MRLRYTRAALADLAAILDHIAARSPQGAARVHRRLRAVAEVLREHPAIGRKTDDPVIRRAVASPYPYLIFYEPTPDAIVVHAVRHAARDPAGMPGSPP